MALSVLPIFSSAIVYGLWDSTTRSYLCQGKEEAMYRLKHTLEQAEQCADNEAWAVAVVQRRIEEQVAGGAPRAAAERCVQKILPESYATWKRKGVT